MSSVANSDRLPFRHILVATDFSPASTQAVLQAVAFAKLYSSSLFIANILPPDAPRSASDDAWRAGQRLETELLVGGQLRGVDHKLVVGSGEIWEGLSRAVAHYAIDLIVVGTRGRTGLARVLLGSVAERIFRKSNCPVLTVGPRSIAVSSDTIIRRVLFATDFTQHSLYALPYAISVARQSGASLALLHLVPDLAKESVPSKESSLEAVRQRLRELVPQDAGIAEPDVVVGFGKPVTRILAVAAEQAPELIVMGLRQPADPLAGRRWMTAFEIAGKANCGVLTVRAPAGL